MSTADATAFDAAYTRCAAAEVQLRRLLAERTGDPLDELQGALSYSEHRQAQRLRKEPA